MLREDVADDSSVDIGQTEIAARVAIRQLPVVLPEQMQDRGVKVVQVDFVFDGRVAELSVAP